MSGDDARILAFLACTYAVMVVAMFVADRVERWWRTRRILNVKGRV